MTRIDTDLLERAVAVADRAGRVLLARYAEGSRPADRAAMYRLGTELEAAAGQVVRSGVDGLVPGAGWFDEDAHGHDVPAGAWWVVDGAEGAVNHVHGLPEWGLTITLVVDGTARLTVVRQPLGDLTWTAIRGAGARRNGRRLRVSAKVDLDAAIVTSSQAGNDPTVHARYAAAFAAMADRSLLVRNTIPTTFPLLGVAGGHYDAFWQYDPDLPGTAAGTLIAAEAGAVVTDLTGQAWRLDAPDVLVAAPGVHAAVLDVVAATVAA